jgi:hypothetical protein
MATIWVPHFPTPPISQRPFREPVDGDSVQVSAQFRMASGLFVPVFGAPNICTVNLETDKLTTAGVRVWTDSGVLVYSRGFECGPPEIYRGVDSQGKRILVDAAFTAPDYAAGGAGDAAGALPWSHLTHSCRTVIDHLRTGAPLAVSGHDIRQGLEVSTAAYQSAMRGGVPMALPLADRRGSPIYPRGYRWGGGDSIGSVQSASQVAENGGRSWEGLSTGCDN